MKITFTIPGQPISKGGRGSMTKATDVQIIDAYAAGGSCKSAARLLGMCPQSVHERLRRLGKNRSANVFTDEDRSRLHISYEQAALTGRLDDLARSMDRTKQFICRQARALGLTDMRRAKPYLAAASSMAAKARIAANGHPRGMAGKSHSSATKARIAETSRDRWAAMSSDERADFTMNQLKGKAAKSGLVSPRPETTWKAGWREVAGRNIYFRSRWEANYGRYLEWLRSRGDIAGWEHEPIVFWFDKIKRGCRSYLPDFRVVENDGRVVFHEVKGWMDERSKTKIKRMRIYHPKVILAVIDGRQYAELRKKISSLVPEWES